MEIKINAINAYEALGRLIATAENGSPEADDLKDLMLDVWGAPEEDRELCIINHLVSDGWDVEEIPEEAAELLGLDVDKTWFKW